MNTYNPIYFYRGKNVPPDSEKRTLRQDLKLYNKRMELQTYYYDVVFSPISSWRYARFNA